MGIMLDKNKDHALELSPSLKLSCQLNKMFGMGLEYYSALGELKHFEPEQNQRHQLFGAVDWEFTPDWEFNAGLGYGMATATDKWVFQFILCYRLPF